jgi:hypothetical protein
MHNGASRRANSARSRHFFQSFNSGNRVTVLHARDVAAQQTRAFLDVALRQILLFAQSLQSFSYNHSEVPPSFVLQN